MKTKVLVITIIAILLVGGGVGAYLLLKDNDDVGVIKTTKSDNGIAFNEENNDVTNETTNEVSNSKTEEKIAEEIKEISKTNSEKIEINEKLATTLFYIIDDLRTSQNLSYGNNLVDSEITKYYVIWEAIPNSYFKFNEDENGNEVTGAKNIPTTTFNKYYKEIFGKEADFNKIANLDIPYGIKIKNEMIYGTRPTNREPKEFALKMHSISYNTSENIYTMNINYLSTTDYDTIEKVSDSNTLSWDKSLNYAKLEIKYKKDKNENYKLLSMVLEKVK